MDADHKKPVYEKTMSLRRLFQHYDGPSPDGCAADRASSQSNGCDHRTSEIPAIALK
jgi:hypothetical protein